MGMEIKLAKGFSADLGERLIEAFYRRFWDLWVSILLSKFKAITPFDTGQLRRALRAEIRGDKFIIGFKPAGFYWIFQRGLEDKYLRIYNAELPGMIELAYQQAKQDVGF